MKSMSTNYKCNNCDNGVVIYKISKGKADNLTVEIKNCNKCFKYFGVKGIQSLKEIQPCK